MPGLWRAVPQAWIFAVAVGAYLRWWASPITPGPGALYQPGVRAHPGAAAGLVCVPGWADDAGTIGAALLAAATGRGHRLIAERLGVPADTVRGWLRAARAGSQWLCQRAAAVHGWVNPIREDHTLPVAGRTPLGYAVDALGRCRRSDSTLLWRCTGCLGVAADRAHHQRPSTTAPAA